MIHDKVFEEDKEKHNLNVSESSVTTNDLGLKELKGGTNDAVMVDLDSSFDFKEENKDHQKLFNKRAKFSYL